MADGRSTDSCPTDAQIESIASGIRVSDQLAAHIARCERCAESIRLAKFRKRFERVMSDEPLQTGLRIDSSPEIFGYSVLGIIARGGQGVVYHARQDTTGQEVAIKVLDPTLSGMQSQSRERMTREIQIISSLHHPGIVRTLDSIKLNDGRDALVMEYIKGSQLNQWRRQNPNCPEETLLELFASIADAVHHAHQRGIIHRDLKPSNILIDEHGHARILDFGVARWMDILDEESPITRTGEFAGTLSYAAPEQVNAETSSPDIRTDVYALGVIAFEMFTGHMLFPSTGSLQSTIQMITAGQIPHRTRSGISHDAWTVLSKAMATEKHRRYQSAADLAADLRRASRGEAIQARGDSRIYLLRKTIRRHRVALSFALVLIIAVLGVLVSLAVGNERLSNALHASRMLQIRAHLAAGNREQAEDVLWTEIAAGIREKVDPEVAIWSGTAREKELLWCFAEMQSTATCRAVIPRVLRPEYGIWPINDGSFITVKSDGWLARVVRNQIGVEFETLFQLPETAKAIKVTPDGKHLLCFDDGRVWSVSIETGQVVADKVLNGLQLSNTVLSFANWGIGINDRDGNLRVLTVPDLEPAFGQIGVPPMHTPWLDPREHVVAYVDSDAVLHVFDLATDSEIPPTGIVMFDTDEPWPQPQILLSPDRAQVIVAYGGGLLMVNAQQGAQPTPMLDHPGYRVWVNHDPKMTILTAIANGDPTLHMWDTTTRKRLSGFPGHTGSVASHAFTSNGSEVLTVDSEGTLRIWASPSHSWRAAFGQSSALSHQIAFDHTNRLIFIPNHEGDLVSFPIGASNADQTHTAIHQSDDVSRVTLSADRSLIATAGLENTVRVLNRATGQSHDIELPDDVVSVTGLRFSPDESSSLLATSINPARLLIFDPVKESVTHEWEINTKALISGLAWSHDGSMLACSLRNGKIALIRDIDRADVQIIDLDATHLRSLSFVEGQSNLVAVGESGVLYVVDTLTGAIKESERLSEHSLFCVATHPKGQIGVVGDRAGNVKVVDLITLTELATFDAGGSVMWMEFVDEGNALMISALDCPVEIWNLTDLASTLRLIEP